MAELTRSAAPWSARLVDGEVAIFLFHGVARDPHRPVRNYTRKFFHDAGFTDTESQTNFLFVDVKRPIEEFQKACKEGGVRIGRAFPPLTTHARISLGTMEEMQQATAVFGKALGVKAKAA